MALLIDSSVWVDFTRAKSPRRLKQYLAPYILDPEACLAEPVVFEVLRHASPGEAVEIERQFETLYVLPTPRDLWERSAALGRVCRQRGFTAKALDLLIAVVALANEARVVTLDSDFEKIAATTRGLQIELLKRPRATNPGRWP